MNAQSTTGRDSRGYSFSLWLLAGFTFWFILGFPFNHHNESYFWAALLERMSFLQCIDGRMPSVQNYRPFGQAMTWLTYHSSGGSIAPIQVFNICVALIAWLLAFFRIRERRTFGLVGLVIGGALFSGYIYAFHLHGVFYSPVLLQMVVLVFWFLPTPTIRTTVWATVCTAAAALFHPYALIFFIAAAAGVLLERYRNLTRKEIVAIVACSAVTLVLIALLVLLPGDEYPASLSARWAGLLSSYRATELHSLISLLVALLTLCTALSSSGSPRVQKLMLGASLALIVIALAAGLPLLLAWFVVALGKGVLQRRWGLSSMILASIFLPGIAPTGSPTYGVFVCMLSGIMLSLGWQLSEQRLARLWPATGIAIFTLAVLCAILLRIGVPLPVLSDFVKPVIAERERTHQMATILDWWKTSPYSKTPIFLAREAENPVDQEDPGDRRYRPPTRNVHLRSYLQMYLETPHDKSENIEMLVIYFGGEREDVGDLVFEAPGEAAGPAYVFRKLPSERKTGID